MKVATLGLSNYKILIIDDHSSIPAKYILKNDLDSEDIQVVTNKKRIGVSGSRNLAINCATSKYIAFLDADDVYCKNFRFQDVIDDLRRFEWTECQVVILRSLISYPSIEAANVKFGPTNSVLANPIEIISEYIHEAKGASIVTHVWDKLFNVEFLKQSNLKFDETMALYEDTKFSIEVLSKSVAVALIAREMTTHISSRINTNYVNRTLDFFKLSNQLEPLLAHLGFNQANFNAAHLAKTYIALSAASWSEATKGVGNIAKSSLIRENNVNFRAIRSLYLRYLVFLGVWRYPVVMALALKWYAKSVQIRRVLASAREIGEGKILI